ncbi:DUF2029 domain-containing protein [bacterium]|nr:MAG: DUF2029 domain-containing protein [bacterium]
MRDLAITFGDAWPTLFLAAAFGLLLSANLGHERLEQGSFKAFYCAAAAVSTGSSPYRVEPQRTCYHVVDTLTHLPSSAVEPAPLPGYALAPFMLLIRLPIISAQLIFTWLSVAALAITALLVARVTQLQGVAVLLALLPIGYLNIAYGEIPSLVVAVITAAGYLLTRRRWVAAALLAAASMIEPHVGLAVCVALFVAFPRCRLPLLLAVIALAALSVWTLGIEQNLLYFKRVLPAQAVAELVANDQYSLSRVLSVLGAPDRWALAGGTLSYIAVLMFGCFAAIRAARALKRPELVAWLPAAAVLLGGTFVHDVQMIAALPAAFALAVRAIRLRTLACGSLAALTVVWSASGGRLMLLFSLFAILVVAAIARSDWATVRSRTVTVLVVGAGALALLAVHPQVFDHTGAAVISAAMSQPDTLAALNWGAYLRSVPQLSIPRPDVVLLKMPTWAALISLLAVAVANGRPVGAHRTR